jgi:cobalt-zinc-cadmium resistance protein CzcA
MTTEPNRPPAASGGFLEALLGAAIAHRGLVLVAALGLAVLGTLSFRRLPIDAVPDITNVQVQVNTAVPALAPVEVERQITFPIETALAGLPRIEQVRSLSRYGLSQVTVVFHDGTDIYRARQLVGERLQEARDHLPPGLGQPMMGPIATGLGEIFLWSVEADPATPRPDGTPWTPVDLRTMQDWVVKPQVRTVPGVTEVNSIGGWERQVQVSPDSDRLMALGLSFRDVLEAVASNNANAGAGYIEHREESYLVRATGRVETLADIENIVVGTTDGVPVRVRDVADVTEGKDLRTGAATHMGEEAVIGTAIMLVGENGRTVARRVSDRLAEVARSLPAGIRLAPLYDRTHLVDATLHTVRTNLVEGALLVVAVLFALLGNFRAALVVTLTIPLSMLFAVTGMVENRISANLMSLGAIDFGIIVDGAVVMTENILRRLAAGQHRLGRVLTRGERLAEARAAAAEVARPTLFGVGIIMIVYLPILTLTGVEGKMFRPMAEVVLLALAGALLLTFTVVPAALALCLGGRLAERENPVMRAARNAYRPWLEKALARPRLVVIGALLVLGGTGLLANRLGSEFIPSLQEGSLAVQAIRIPSTSLTESVAMQGRLERFLLERFPDEIESIFARVGTAEVATDPMGPNVADTYLMLTPRDAWTKARSQPELAEAVERALADLPGQNYEVTQPIELRFNELISGVRSDIAVKVFGDDLETLQREAGRIAEQLESVPGATGVKVESLSGLPVLTIAVDRAAIARYGLNVADVQAVVETAVGGAEAGQLVEGDRRFDIVVRLADDRRRDIGGMENLPIPLPTTAEPATPLLASLQPDAEAHAAYVPLGAVATIELVEGPSQVVRENGKRRVAVLANVSGRDLGGFVAEARQRIDATVHLPAGYWLSWGGQFENLIAARQRLAIVVPIALVLIGLLLFVSFGSAVDAALVFTGVPLALTGGVIALALRGMPFSIPAGIGFIALSGVAVLNGLVLVTFIRQLRADGVPVGEAIRQGAYIRLRPILMTALVASLGFVPMALAHGTGAEVQQPLATVVIGGILSSTLLTLIVLPVLYRSAHPE